MPSNKPRLTILCDENTYQEVENFRFENRYTNRSNAGYDLVKLGLNIVKNKELFNQVNNLSTSQSMEERNSIIISLIKIGLKHKNELLEKK